MKLDHDTEVIVASKKRSKNAVNEEQRIVRCVPLEWTALKDAPYFCNLNENFVIFNSNDQITGEGEYVSLEIFDYDYVTNESNEPIPYTKTKIFYESSVQAGCVFISKICADQLGLTPYCRVRISTTFDKSQEKDPKENNILSNNATKITRSEGIHGLEVTFDKCCSFLDRCLLLKSHFSLGTKCKSSF